MASNAFGKIFRITTWGESHGKAMGVVIDGCPPGIKIEESLINQELLWRAPGRHSHTSPRKEPDQVEILSGIFEGQSTGTPISLLIWNRDVQSHSYDATKHLLRPGHAHYTYLEKYGCFDHRGGGRASARETVCRVAAGAIAKKMLSDIGVAVVAYVKAIGSITADCLLSDAIKAGPSYLTQVRANPLFCPCEKTSLEMQKALEQAKQQQDSLGGIVEAIAFNVPTGWGDPIYEKLEANLAQAMLSIPASKGFEIGAGFAAASMQGSEHNDLFFKNEEQVSFSSNYAGGVLGGISTGQPVIIRVPFKPTSSIGKEQATLNLKGEKEIFKFSSDARHDPCVAIRAVPVVEAMLALVLVDALLMNRCLSY
jgi:chorismate synthase